MSSPGNDARVTTKRPGRPATITRHDVVTAALGLAQDVGLDRFTMGQLAEKLGVAPMTAYHHVSNRTELVRLVVEELLGRVEIPGPETGPWDVQLKALEANVRRELGGIPGIRTGLGGGHSPGSTRLADAVLTILREAGLDESTALLAYGAMFTYMVGQLDLDLVADRGADPGDASRFVELTARSAGGRRPTPDEFFDFGFDLLLTGLRELLQRQQ